MIGMTFFSNEDAEEFGVPEAILISHIRYWTHANELKRQNNHEGHYWTYDTYESLSRRFPFWSVTQIKRIRIKLEKKGVIITGYFNKKGYDRTTWYRLNESFFNGQNRPMSDNAGLDTELCTTGSINKQRTESSYPKDGSVPPIPVLTSVNTKELSLVESGVEKILPTEKTQFCSYGSVDAWSTKIQQKSQGRAPHLVPDDFKPTPQQVETLSSKVGSTEVDGVVMNFVDHYRSTMAMKSNWNPQFDIWIRNERPSEAHHGDNSGVDTKLHGCNFDAYKEAYNDNSDGLQDWIMTTPKRSRSLQELLEYMEDPSPHNFGAYVGAICEMDTKMFLRGDNKSGWVAGPDYILKIDTYNKTMEGAMYAG